MTPFLPSKASDTVGDASMPLFQPYRSVLAPLPGEIAAGIWHVSCGMEDQLIGYIAHGAVTWVC